ncbi:MAG: DUF1833 family protein [Klebsiella oxytoca]|nr:DUF1833 family protein [Klebsiella oxytoca]
MTQINRLYASSGPEVIIETLQITIGSDVHYLCQGCNIDGVVSTAIRNALANRLSASLTYRSYISTDLAAPAAVPYTLQVKSGYWTATEVQITAGYMNVLDTAWPRYRYTLPLFPGLRYIS